MPAPDAEEAGLYRNRWFRHFWRWQVIHWVMMILIAGGSAAVASAYLSAPDGGKDGLALVVAVLAAIYGAINPGQRAEAYREAWVILNLAVLEGGSPASIVQAYRMGEEIIGRRPSPKAPSAD